MPLAAIQKYLSLSTAIKGVSRAFRDADENAAFFGQSLGLTIAQSSQAAMSLGRQTNTFTRKEFTRNLGFARHTGLDPTQTLGQLGQMSELQGRSISRNDLIQLLQGAKSMNMDQGRMQEWVGMVASTMQQQIGATGEGNATKAIALQGLPGMVFGKDDPRSRGEPAKSFMGGLQNVMTSKGAMSSYLMRVMGYGREGGPSYVQMRKRQEAGLHDRQNIIDLFGSFQERGLGDDAQIRAIESVAGGNLKMHQIESLVGAFGTKKGLDDYRKATKGKTGADPWGYMLSLSEKDYAGFKGTDRYKGGFGELGRGGVSQGEAVGINIERMMHAVGQPLARMIPGLQGALMNLGSSMSKIMGADIGGKLEAAANSVERLTAKIDAMSVKGGLDVFGMNDPAKQYRNNLVGVTRKQFSDELEYAEMMGKTPSTFHILDVMLSQGIAEMDQHLEGIAKGEGGSPKGGGG
tara:strand:- start:12205 stop:13593 length:1389 start_codon:yes stop_codon:yes gene_type:complete